MPKEASVERFPEIVLSRLIDQCLNDISLIIYNPGAVNVGYLWTRPPPPW